MSNMMNMFGVLPDEKKLSQRDRVLAAYPDRLNEIVLRKTTEAIKKSEETGSPLATEFRIVQERMAKYGKHDVYKNQNEHIAYGLMGIALFFICGAPTYFTIAAVGVIMMLWYDFYSGVLHIVLDHPRHMLWPVLDEPCLEFQWHHHIPHDIADKSWIQSCGDLNVAAGAMAVINFWGMGLGWSKIGGCVIGWKLIQAYIGQYNHRVSHLTKKEKHPVAAWAQSVGLLLSDKAHRVHHQGVHDSNFCIGLGLLNDQLNWFTKNVCGNPTAWCVWFLTVSVVDCWCITWLLETYGGPVINGAAPTIVATLIADAANVTTNVTLA